MGAEILCGAAKKVLEIIKMDKQYGIIGILGQCLVGF